MNLLEYKLISNTAKEPTREHLTDAGIDLYTDEELTLRPQDKATIRTGIAINIPQGYAGLLNGRSGISSKTDLVITQGIIDAGFHGNLGIMIKNDSMEHTYDIKHHMKLAQLIIVPIVTPRLTIVDEFSTVTERGEKGFGSSGE